MLDLNLRLTGGLLDDRGQRSGFLLLAALLLSFLFIRTSARMTRSERFAWWPGAVKTPSGLHIHHLVWGIGLILVSGFFALSFDADSPWREVLAITFGVGAGLVLDEFALIVHLDDVYWAEEGRKSLDAVVISATLAGLVVLGLAPFDLAHADGSVAAIALSAFGVFCLATVAIAKGKLLTGAVGIFVPVIALVGAVRVARPHSPWARRRYATGSRKARVAATREARRHRLHSALQHRVGGVSAAAPPEDPRRGGASTI